MARPKHSVTMARHAKSALLAAVEIYNKAVFPYREHTFAILMVNAWEILLKAKIVHDAGNVRAIYQRDGTRYRRDRDMGYPMTIPLKRALSEVSLPEKVTASIRIMITIRNQVLHFGNLGAGTQQDILAYGTASVQNFTRLYREWFNEIVGDIYLLPIGFLGDAHLSTTKANVGQRQLLDSLSSIAAAASNDKSDYAVRLHVDIQINPQFTGGGSIGITADPSAPMVQVSDDKMLERWPDTYNDILSLCRERYDGFKQNLRFHRVMKAIKENPNCAHERRLDPRGAGTTGKMFYNREATLAMLDAEYAP